MGSHHDKTMCEMISVNGSEMNGDAVRPKRVVGRKASEKGCKLVGLVSEKVSNKNLIVKLLKKQGT